MPDDPKKTFKRIRAQQAADVEAEAERNARAAIARQRQRREQQPVPDGALAESPNAQWVRENFSWEPHPSLWVPQVNDHEICSWSDYSGSTIDKANAKYLKDHFDIFEEGYGGHGSVWVGISEDNRLRLSDENKEALEDILRGLADYPLIDEDIHSTMEMEAKWEDWKEYGRDAVREALIKKFEGDPNAQIAVALQRNEFWDNMCREHGWDQYMDEEPGGSYAIHEESMVREIGKDEIVNEEAVGAFKRSWFLKNHGQDWERLLTQAGVMADTDYNLWTYFEHAERLVGSENVWEIKDRFYNGTEEMDPDDVVDLATGALEEMAQRLNGDQTSAAIRNQMANDPRQQKLPGFESQAQRLVADLLEIESPKAAFIALPRGRAWEITWFDMGMRPRLSRFNGYSATQAEEKLLRDNEVLRVIKVTPWLTTEAEDPKSFIKKQGHDLYVKDLIAKMDLETVPHEDSFKEGQRVRRTRLNPFGARPFGGQPNDIGDLGTIARFVGRKDDPEHSLYLVRWDRNGYGTEYCDHTNVEAAPVAEAEDPKKVFRNLRTQTKPQRFINAFLATHPHVYQVEYVRRPPNVYIEILVLDPEQQGYANVHPYGPFTEEQMQDLRGHPELRTAKWTEREAIGEAEDPKEIFRKAKSAQQQKEARYVIAGIGANGFNVYWGTRDSGRTGWTFSLGKAQKFLKDAAIQKMEALRTSYPSVHHRTISRLSYPKVMEAEDPKSVLRALQRTIDIRGRRWFRRGPGNTYHAADIFVNGKLVHMIEFAYGYGDQYLWNATSWLAKNGYLPGIEENEALWRYCERNRIKLTYSAEDVKRKKHL